MNKISVEVRELISIYCDLHNLLIKANPSWFDEKVLGRDAKDNLNRQLMFTKKKLIEQLENGLKQKLNLPAEQNIFKADYDYIIKKLLGELK